MSDRIPLPPDDPRPDPIHPIEVAVWCVVAAGVITLLWVMLAGCATTGVRTGDRTTDTATHITGGGVDSVTAMLLAAGTMVSTIGVYMFVVRPLVGDSRKRKLVDDLRDAGVEVERRRKA